MAKTCQYQSEFDEMGWGNPALVAHVLDMRCTGADLPHSTQSQRIYVDTVRTFLTPWLQCVAMDVEDDDFDEVSHLALFYTHDLIHAVEESNWGVLGLCDSIEAGGDVSPEWVSDDVKMFNFKMGVASTALFVKTGEIDGSGDDFEEQLARSMIALEVEANLPSLEAKFETLLSEQDETGHSQMALRSKYAAKNAGAKAA